MLAAIKGYAAAGFKTTVDIARSGLETTVEIARELKGQTYVAATTIASAVAGPTTPNPTAGAGAGAAVAEATTAAAAAAPQTPLRAAAVTTAAAAEAGTTSSPKVKELIAQHESRSPAKKPGMVKKQGSFIQRLSERISPGKGKNGKDAAGATGAMVPTEVVTSLSPPAPIRKTLASPVAKNAVVAAAAAATTEAGQGNSAPTTMSSSSSSSSSSSMATPPTASAAGGNGSAGRAKTPVSAEPIKKTLSGRLLFRTPSRKSSAGESPVPPTATGGRSSSNPTQTPVSVPTDKAPSGGSVNGSESPTSAASSSPSSVDGGDGNGKGLGRQGSIEKLKTTVQAMKSSYDWR